MFIVLMRMLLLARLIPGQMRWSRKVSGSNVYSSQKRAYPSSTKDHIVSSIAVALTSGRSGSELVVQEPIWVERLRVIIDVGVMENAPCEQL